MQNASRRRHLAVALTLSVLASGAPAAAGGAAPSAAAAPQQGQHRVVAAEEVREQTAFLGGRYIDVAGRVPDLFAFCQDLTIEGSVGDNALALCETVHLRAGQVAGDLFAFCDEVVIEGELQGDVYAFCGSVLVEEGGVVHGGVYAATGEIRVRGRVDGPLVGGAGSALIEGSVGSIDLELGRLELGPEAVVAGDVDYVCARDAVVAQGASIGGALRRTQPEESLATGEGKATDFLWTVGVELWFLLGGLFVGVLLLWLLGPRGLLPSEALAERPAQCLGVGFLVFVLLPAACFALSIALVGLPAGLLGFLMYAVLFALAPFVVAINLGRWLLRRMGGSDPRPLPAFCAGLVVLHVLTLLPWIGWLLWIGSVVAGMGGVWLVLRGGRGGGAAPAPAA